MKKLMILSVAVLAFSSVPALADHHGEGGKKGPMFSKHDTNGDGVISEEEFLSHAAERFSNIDADGDGSVSKEEAKAGHEKKRAEIKERMQERKEKRQERRDDSGAE